MPVSGNESNYTRQVLRLLAEMGLKLPENSPPPAGQYVPFRLHRGLGFLAAQTPGYGENFPGQIGTDLTPEQGRLAAQQAGLHALARIHEALGGFDRLVGLLHVAGHVSSAPDFIAQPEVLDGASRLFNEALGERGRHSRTAYAPAYLPKRISIELEITFAYRD